MILEEIIAYYLNCDIYITFDWSDYDVPPKEEALWISEMEQLFYDLTTDDIIAALKWCNYKGDEHEQVRSAIHNMILLDDLPLSCDFEIEFREMGCEKV